MVFDEENFNLFVYIAQLRNVVSNPGAGGPVRIRRGLAEPVTGVQIPAGPPLIVLILIQTRNIYMYNMCT